MKIMKKLLVLLISVIIISFICVNTCNVYAGSGVQEKINQLHSMYPDGYKFQKNYGGGSLCYAFANYIWDYIFGKSIYTDKHFEDVSLSDINSKAKIGDYIEFRHRNHACIYLGPCDNGFYAFTSNYTPNENDVKYNRKYTESGTFRIFHASNYDEINGSGSTPQIVDDYYKLTPPDGYLSLRSSASTSASELARIPTGTIVNVTQYNSDKSWGYLTYDGKSGWIRLYYVEKTSKPQSINDYYKLTAPDGYQSLRSSASTSASELARIPTGTIVNVTQYNSDKTWGYLTYDGKSGWIRLYYVEKTDKPHTHSYSEYVYNWSAHPHYKCYKCSCGEIKENKNEPTFVNTCAQCLETVTPTKPVLTGIKETYFDNESITFNWNDCSNTTHYNFWLFKMNDIGEWEKYKHGLCVEKGFSLQLPLGQYYVIIQSYNNNYYKTDGSDWLYCESDRYYLDVLKKTIPGDIDGNEGITDADAIYLLMHTFFPEDYPISQPCDYDGDGRITDADAIYLLMYTFFPEDYPIQ